MRKEREILQQVKGLIKEGDTHMKSLEEAVREVPRTAQDMLDLLKDVTATWGSAYEKFKDIRRDAYDLMATGGVKTKVKRPVEASPDVTGVPASSLIRMIHRLAHGFREAFKDEVINQALNLEDDFQAIIEAARSADSVSDKNLQDKLMAFSTQYIPWRTAISDYVYRNLEGITRRAEALYHLSLDPEDRPGKIREKKKREVYRGKTQSDTRGVIERAQSGYNSLNQFVNLARPTLSKIDEIVRLADELAQTLKHEIDVPEPVTESDDIVEGRRRKVNAWMEHNWCEDSEIGAFI